MHKSFFYAPNYQKRRRQDATNFAIRIMTMWWTFLDAGKRKVFKSKVTSFHICDLVRSLQYVSKICSLKLEMLCSKVFSSLSSKCDKIWSRIGVRIKISPYIEPTAISSALNIIFLLCHSHSYVFFLLFVCIEVIFKSYSSHFQVILPK